MGQKVNPISLRLGYIKTWDSSWYARGNDYITNLHQDFEIRRYISSTLSNAAISRVVIERAARKVKVIIHSARPAILIGKKGADVDKVKKAVEKIVTSEVSVNIIEVKKPELDATLIAQNMAQQLERRVAFRKVAKRAVQSAMRMGAKGIRVNVSGRLGGAEIARMEWYREGRVPLHSLRANIDYAIYRANTVYGVIGVKVWVYLGDFRGIQEGKE